MEAWEGFFILRISAKCRLLGPTPGPDLEGIEEFAVFHGLPVVLMKVTLRANFYGHVSGLETEQRSCCALPVELA